MIAAVDIGLRASLVVLAALVASAALRRRSAALRHWILAAGMVAAATVAPLGRALPSWDVAFEPAKPIGVALATLAMPVAIEPAQSITMSAAPDSAAVPSGRTSLSQTLNTLWAIGTAVAFALMALNFARLSRVIGTATAMTDRRWTEALENRRQRLQIGGQVSLLRSDRAGLVGTYGWRRPRVLLPPDCDSWSDERIDIVLGHELAHIRRGDWGIQVVAEAVRGVFWYNPLFWIACGQLRCESERACDDAVLDGGVTPADYAAHLLAIARTSRRPLRGNAVVSMARRSTLERRITAMLNTTLVHRRPTRRASTIALASIVGITVAAASFRASAQVEPRPLTGTVYDMTGAVLPQAALTLADASGMRQSATTDRDGRFALGVIAPGRYLLSASLIGFLPVTQEITLRDASQWDRVLMLHVGTLQETVTVSERRPASAPPQAPSPVPVGGNIRTPRKVLNVNPIYPQALRDAGLEGVVPLGAVIGADGSIVSVRVLGAHSRPELVKSAVDAVRQWRFTPTLLNGDAIDVYMTVTVRFTLED